MEQTDEQIDILVRKAEDQIEFSLLPPIDFRAEDTESRQAQVRLLTAAAAYYNAFSVGEHGGRIGAARAPGLVEQAVAAPFQSFGGEELYAEPFARAAALLRGITQGHPFNDGNRRSGFLTAAFYLRRVGFPPPAHLPFDAVVELCLGVSAGEMRCLRHCRRVAPALADAVAVSLRGKRHAAELCYFARRSRMARTSGRHANSR